MGNDKTRIERMNFYFSNTGVDYSNFVEDLTDGAHISRFIRNHVYQGYKFKLETDKNNIHTLSHNGKDILYFLTDFADIQYNDIFVGNKMVVDIPQYNIKMHYLVEGIKNILFMDYLTTGSDFYSKYIDVINDHKLFFKELVAKSSLVDDIPFSVDFKKDHITFSYPDRNIEFIIKNEKKEHLLFQVNTHSSTIKKKNFGEFIGLMNSLIYVEIVNKHTDITANNFTTECREIVKMFEI